ncbi:YdcF family protein [Enterobacillus tribolii]|uniref:DUF218 domain-containing protein n=1 Tax=Enterobacillus tribolii TaxID=1487935 RepID=A0A370Q944_9GAMM|nr:YdcF family protein [Enterobacillus tribolii]MBW7984580.1 YdcF family protein [Enterobacillus tribolii]RDK84570.1 DUF218 domain-containing protein [Enterobacillus tribolii]
MNFSPRQISDINALAAFLACDQTGGSRPERLASQWHEDAPGLAILLGNAVLETAERLFLAMENGLTCRLLIAGGIGHSTPLLYQAVAAHPQYHCIAVQGRPEADILRDIAVNFWRIAPQRILIENVSTNCGDNAIQAARVLRGQALTAHHILLVQDPLMQRRSDASFRQVWRDFPAVRFTNWPTFVPRIDDGGNGWADPALHGLWSWPRFISLLLGEIPRLRDAPGGYGPRGAGFIAHVDIPDAVEQAYRRLNADFGQAFGDRA